MRECLWIGLAGFAGALARYWTAAVCGRLFGAGFPVGTMLVNITGSLFLGWFLTSADRVTLSPNAKMAVAVGFVGSFTTFSTLMYETAHAATREGAMLKALLNLGLSLALGLAAVRVGMMLGER